MTEPNDNLHSVGGSPAADITDERRAMTVDEVQELMEESAPPLPDDHPLFATPDIDAEAAPADAAPAEAGDGELLSLISEAANAYEDEYDAAVRLINEIHGNVLTEIAGLVNERHSINGRIKTLRKQAVHLERAVRDLPEVIEDNDNSDDED